MIVLQTPEIFTPEAQRYSRWMAAYNPMRFLFQREDETGTVTDGGVFISVTLGRLLSDAEVSSAKQYPVRVRGTNYDFSLIASGVITNGSGFSVLQFSRLFTPGSDQTVKVKVQATKPGYKIQIGMKADGVENYYTCSADKNGVSRADIQVYLSSLVSPSVLSKRVSIRYRELWDNFYGDWAGEGNDYFVTYSAMQLGDRYGGNMMDYVSFPDELRLSSWMTKFKQPVYNTDLPFEISFISSEYTSAFDLKCELKYVDINKTQISSDILSIGVRPAGVINLPISSTPEERCKFIRLQVYYGNKIAVTKPIYLAVKRNYSEDPYVYLKWVNNIGGYEYFRFGYNQVRTTTTSNTSVLERNIFDYANDTDSFDVANKSGARKMQFGAKGLTEIEGIESLSLSIKVYMLMQNGKFNTVELIPGTFNFGDTRKSSFSVQYSINLPEINIQRQ